MTQVKKTYSKEELIKRVAKKKRRRNLLAFFFIVCIFITLCLKIPYFNIKSFDISGNENLTYEEVSGNVEQYLGKNIFCISKDDIKSSLEKNPFIRKASVKKSFPNKVIITVQETKSKFYVQDGEKYYILDDELTLLNVKENIDDENLTLLTGQQWKDISDESKSEAYSDVSDIIKDLSTLIDDNISGIKITSVDIPNRNNVSVYCNNMQIKLGSSDNLKEKLNKAFNILQHDESLLNSTGYIDVSFNGNPVLFRQQ